MAILLNNGITVIDPTKSDRDLGNLTSPTAVNEDLLPASDNSKDLGSSGARWAEVHAVTVSADTIQVEDSGSANKISITAPALAGNVSLTLPPNDGDAGDVLTSDGAGVLTWEPPAGGSPAFDPTTSKITIFDDFIESGSGTVANMGPFGFHVFNGDVNAVNATHELGVWGFFGSSPGDQLGVQAGIEAIKLGNATITYAVRSQIDSGAPTVNDDYNMFIGLIEDMAGNTDPQNGLFFYIDRVTNATNYLVKSIKGGVSNVQDTGVAIDANMHVMRIEINTAATQVDYYIDGNLVYSEVDSAKIPVVSISPAAVVNVIALSNFIDLLTDFALLDFTPGTARGVY